MSVNASILRRRDWLAATLAVAAWHCAGVAPAAEPVDFSRDIQPLLAKRCFSCHGPDGQEGGLRLDQHDAATAELSSGVKAIVPGDASASAIIERITSTDPDVQMPPEGPRLAAGQVDAIRRWIDEGAHWKEHWAFRPLVRPAVPGAATADAPAKHPIDAFIEQGLSGRGLPVPERADRVALLRRATYDLTGLPPSEQEIRDFLADDSPHAWEKVVDRLLASPHYGEKWARHWLDLVRYADTNSFERDGPKPHSWRYRDYVIRSLNADKPYDQFVIEQLAGDELPTPTPDGMIATGYYRLGLWDDEPADRLQAKYDWLDDIVSTTGQTFLGLTVNCARCHDHKIDPLPQKDYYGLLAFFHNITPMANNGGHIERPIVPDEATRKAREERVAELNRRRDDAQRAVSEIEGRFRTALAKDAAGGDLDDLEFRFYRDTWTSLPNFDELKAEDTGRVPAQVFDIGVAPSLRPDSFGYVFTGFLKVPAAGDYVFTLDSDDGSRLTLDGHVVLEHDGIHGEGSPKRATMPLQAGRLPVRLDYFQGYQGKGLTVTWAGPGFAARPLSATAAAAVNLAEAIRRDGERVLGADGKRDYDAKLAHLERVKKEQVPEESGTALVVSEHGPNAPETFIFYRGNPHAEQKPEHKVEPAFPAILKAKVPEIELPRSRTSSGRRTALAAWIVSPDNPLTARVMANRIWQHHFGRGIVRSTSNFGMMGDPPTHPELLDWLASELIAGNWRLKSLHKLILMSRTYQATSAGNATALAKDPLNDSFWRYDMRRLTAEELRDSIHVVSGAFNPKMYGPGYFPEIPREVMAGQSQPGNGWGNSPPEEQARRSVYIHVKRSLLTPILADFDMADTDTGCPVRFVTTQPTQALGMMNGDFLHKQARAFADRVRREAGGSDGTQTAAMVRRALELALARTAADDEVARGTAVVDALAHKQGVTPGRALELYCLLVLNLNEFAYLD